MTRLIIILSSILLSGCALIGKDELGLERQNAVSYKKEFWKIPCFWDGEKLNEINEELIPKE